MKILKGKLALMLKNGNIIRNIDNIRHSFRAGVVIYAINDNETIIDESEVIYIMSN